MHWRAASIAAALAGFGSPTASVAQEAKPRVAEIDWSQADVIGVSSGLRERVPDADQSYLPVLIPRGFFDFNSFQFVGQPLEYSASVRLNNASLSMVGTRIALDSGTPENASDDETLVQLDVRSARASKTIYGAAYSVSVECKSKTDPKCADERYVRDLLASVELLGGGRGAPLAVPGVPAAPNLISVSADPTFQADPPGKLLEYVRGQPREVVGVTSGTIFAPNILFPVKTKPAFLNSQVYGYGGSLGPKGDGWGDKKNYKYPWRDNFCETRSRRTPACPSGMGHQGVDIRPMDKADRKHMAVAVEPGRIVKVGVYSVTLAGNSGNHYNYLHLEMDELKVKLGQTVAAGQDIGLISNDFGGTVTTVHLHFEIMQNANGRGWRHAPPYSSLIAAYK